MNKTPDLSAIMADYTAQVRAEEKRRQAIRDAAAADPRDSGDAGTSPTVTEQGDLVG